MTSRKKDNKYVFNPKTLNFDRFTEPLRERVGKVLVFLLTTFILAFLMVLLFYFFFGSPKEKMQAREIEYLKLQYEILDDKLEDMQVLVEDLEQRDNNIYRMIFEAEPIPSAVRKSGFSEADRYEDLYGYKSSDIVMKVAGKLDVIMSQLYYQSKSYDDVFAMASTIIPQPLSQGRTCEL